MYAGPLNAVASDVVNYDSDGDGLIEIRSLAQLNAVRWDLDGDGMVTDDTTSADVNEADEYAAAFPQAATGMGCPATGCVGYELAMSLDFDTDTAGVRTDDAYYNGGEGWEPIGCCGSDDRFTATFEGNGHTIANLFIEQSTSDRLGLFGRIGDDNTRGGTVRNLVLTGADVTGDDYIGILAGRSYGTAAHNTVISNVSVSGSVTAGDDWAGGLVAEVSGDTTIASSYSSAAVSGDDEIGGLVGENEGSILASYATGSVSGADDVGGLVGDNSGAITASYSTGAVSGSSNVGGLVGTSTGTVTNSYWDTGSLGPVHQRRRHRQDRRGPALPHGLRHGNGHLRQLEPGPGQRRRRRQPLHRTGQPLGLRRGLELPDAPGRPRQAAGAGAGGANFRRSADGR